MILRISFFLIFFLFIKSSYALNLPKEVLQGSLIIGQEPSIDQIMVDNVKTKLSEEGYYVFPVGRDHINPIQVITFLNNKIIQIHEINIIKQEYDIQRIDGLPEEMVTPLDDEIIQRIITENKTIKEKKLIDSDYIFFTQEFVIPTEGIISGLFGSQRILNDKPKSPHKGIDIAANEGTPVLATNDGIIILAEKDFYYTGGTIILDHGHGVKSIYAHLSEVIVKSNDRVLKNEAIGAVGSTGRSTGPHLHWGVMVFDVYVDPKLLIN